MKFLKMDYLTTTFMIFVYPFSKVCKKVIVKTQLLILMNNI